MLKVVFFDAASTLFEARAPIGASYARIARKYGVEASGDAVSGGFRRVFHNAPGLAFGPGRAAGELRELEYRWWRDIVARTFAGLGAFTDFDAYFAELFTFFGNPANWEVDPIAPVTLQALRDRGLKLGIISNFDYRLYGILDGLGLAGYFDSITISSEAGFAKPAPEAFLIAMAKHSVAPGEAMHVGDSARMDVDGALAVGIAGVLIDPQAGAPIAVDGRRACIATLAAVANVAQHIKFP
jgi:putative hydrolase of the HAD superfamily